MSPDPNAARAIFMTALDKTEPAERAAYLAQACGGDDALRHRVEVLLKANDDPGSFLKSRAENMVATIDTPVNEHAGTIIGPYKLLEQIGEGGMGTVYLAQQTEPVKRLVALKVIKAGMDSRQVIARFEAERQALALMDHPNIARVFDAGTMGVASASGEWREKDKDSAALATHHSPLATACGRPYFVMELVKGVPLTKYCDEHRLTPKERLELFIPVCQAIQHAHQKGIIHRDIKPSNVLVASYDGKPVPKVIDFGVAKATGQQLTERTLVTGLGAVVGTLEYMSPEQAELNQLDIDTRSDIYSLGVLLYELLTGSTPLEKKRLKAAALLEVLRLIREEEPPKPSTRLSTADEMPSVAANRGLEPKKLSGLVRGELDWIVMKALDKDRNRRYETANGLAMDVQRYLNDEPVAACPPSAWYRFRKFARRHKAGLRIAAAAALVLLLAAAGVSWALWDQAARRSELSERMAETEQTVNAALIQTEQWRKQAGEAPSATSQEADAVLVLWRQAEMSLGQAQSALRTGTADDRLRQRVLDVRQQIGQQRTQAQRTANLLRDLDDARMTHSIWIETHFDYAGASTKYAAAFAAYGLEVKPGRTEELARRIRAEQPAIREALIVALDDWSQTAAWAKTAELANLVRAIATTADDDPWRQKYRAVATASDATALRALSGQARRLSLPPSSLHLLARSLNFQGARDEALTLLRWARGRHLTDFWIHFELGAVLQGKDKSPLILEETIGCYRTALALRPAASAVHINLGCCLLDRKQLDEAMAEFRKAIELDPKLAFAWDNRGVIYYELKQFDKALADFSKAIELDPKLANAWCNRGNAYCQLGQWDQAFVDYAKAIELDPKDAMAWYNRGDAYSDLKQWHKALADFSKAIELDPKLALAWCSRGNAYKNQKRFDKALADASKAIELDPTKAYAWRNRGSIYSELKQWDKALADYTKAIELDPTNAPGWNSRGDIYSKLKQFDKALAHFTKAIEIDPKNADGHNELAWLLATHPNPKARDPRRAVELAKKAVELAPKVGMFWNTLGVARYRAGAWKAALAALEKSMELGHGGDSIDWFFLAMSHEKLGDKEKARQWYDRAVEWMDKNQATNEELRSFRAEAAQVLGVDKKKD